MMLCQLITKAEIIAQVPDVQIRHNIKTTDMIIVTMAPVKEWDIL